MAWRLTELCLKCVENNMACFPDLGSLLPVMYQETLIERLTCHDHLYYGPLQHISKSLFTSALRHIYLRGCSQVTDEVLQLLGKSGCRLEVLVLSRLNHVSDIGVQAVTRGQNALLVLEIELLPLITQQILTSISSPTLWSFKLVTVRQSPINPWYTVATLTNFLSQNPAIKVLEMYLDTEHIPLVAKGLNISLAELTTQYQTVTDEGIEALAQFCPNLRT
ncbi:hypothetical protein BsWGS_05205 [Bradybaena similaris]